MIIFNFTFLFVVNYLLFFIALCCVLINGLIDTEWVMVENKIGDRFLYIFFILEKLINFKSD